MPVDVYAMSGTFFQILPATVLAAIVIFLAREILELLRRRSSEKRRVQAIKTLLAREIEQNNWAIKSLKNILAAISSTVIEEVEEEIEESDHSVERFEGKAEVVLDKLGSYRFRLRYKNGSLLSSVMLPAIRTAELTKVMLEVATLDRRLFEKLEKAYDATSELAHVRDLLITHVNNDEPETEGWLGPFVHYAEAELATIHAELTELYAACTHKKVLEDHRLR